MITRQLSTCFCTAQLTQCKTFYQQNFNASITFDCGWYVSLLFGKNNALSFMEPQEGVAVFDGAGVTLNFEVDDVDAEYDRLAGAGLSIGMPLEDHPWGDRGFSVLDPIGNNVYIYSEREPDESFKEFFVSD